MDALRAVGAEQGVELHHAAALLVRLGGQQGEHEARVVGLLAGGSAACRAVLGLLARLREQRVGAVAGHVGLGRLGPSGGDRVPSGR